MPSAMALTWPSFAQNHGRPTKHKPEIILNRFNTQLGTRIGRLLASLYPQAPQFRGRQVATFHNQRDFIFFRCRACACSSAFSCCIMHMRQRGISALRLLLC